MTSALTPIGHSKWDLDTPALLADLDALEGNIRRLTATFREAGVNWRPHTKGIKIPAVAHKLLDAGAVGVCCAKLSEAEVLAAAGIKDIVIVNQIVGPQKVARLVNLRRQTDVAVAVDSVENVRELAQAARAQGVELRVLVEVNTGLNRCGVEPGAPVVALAQAVQQSEGLHFLGVVTWEGTAGPQKATPEERRETVFQSVRLLTGSADLCRQNGIPVAMVLCGGTATYQYSAFVPGVTDVKAGGGVWCDKHYREDLHVDHDYALTVVATVISRPNPTRVVTDAGIKALSANMGNPLPLGCGQTTKVWLSAEYGLFEMAEPSPTPKVGDKIEWLVGYSDTTVCLHDELYGIRDGKVEVVWPIAGRGKFT
ncbi:MAG: DSD1 family PLP-dependent enzyme [Chloroflexi bacterium]|nr:DSD1 family PLP-dependent enzyme [Bacteroidota bacterium]MCL5111100.1 DSD1 family PLP-dependent enzyme [Chloroflexota bacterium]